MEDLVTPHGCLTDCVGAYCRVDTAVHSLFVKCSLPQTTVDARSFSTGKARALAKKSLREVLRVEGFTDGLLPPDGSPTVEEQYSESPVLLSYAEVRARDFTFVCPRPGCGRKFLSESSRNLHALQNVLPRHADDTWWREGAVK